MFAPGPVKSQVSCFDYGPSSVPGRNNLFGASRRARGMNYRLAMQAELLAVEGRMESQVCKGYKTDILTGIDTKTRDGVIG